jgi:hypothetical protein
MQFLIDGEGEVEQQEQQEQQQVQQERDRALVQKWMCDSHGCT